jgi:hypothetical protein
MLQNAFIGKPEKPTDEELAAELGSPSQALWDQLVTGLAREYGVAIQEWNSYSRKAGWSLRLKRGERNIVYLAPSRGCFLASFALGDKAIQAARRSKLPPGAIKILDEARRYAEGTAVRIEVHAAKDIAIVKKLAVAKLEN